MRCCRCTGHQRRLNAGIRKVSDEIVDVALEPAEPVQREHRSSDDGNSERRSHVDALSRILSTAPGSDQAEIQIFDSPHDVLRIESALDMSHCRLSQLAAQRLVVGESSDIAGERRWRHRQQACFFMLHDIRRAAGVHGGDRHAESTGLDQHPAQ